MNVAIVSIGDELMNGFTIDSNSSWIAKNLLQYEPFEIVSKITASDNIIDIKASIDSLVKKKINYIFVTGGLGPTHDDITKKALSEYFDTNIVLNESYYKRLKAFFKNKESFHLKSQAEILENSSPIPNRFGTALGMFVKYRKSNIFVLPGVPKEVKGMFEKEIFPSFLDPLFSKEKKHITLLTTGIYESKLFKILEDTINSNLNLFKLSFLPKHTGVNIRLSKKERNADLEKFKKQILQKIEKYTYGIDDQKIEEIVATQLINKSLTVAVAESCTGGLISKKMTDVAGSSIYFKGSIIAYDNSIKKNFLNVSEDLLKNKGAVSEEVCLKMAEEVKEKSNTDIGISTTGISGPNGGTNNKPVGLVYIAVIVKNTKIVKKYNLIPQRKEHREVSAHTALNMLRLVIK